MGEQSGWEGDRGRYGNGPQDVTTPSGIQSAIFQGQKQKCTYTGPTGKRTVYQKHMGTVQEQSTRSLVGTGNPLEIKAVSSPCLLNSPSLFPHLPISLHLSQKPEGLSSVLSSGVLHCSPAAPGAGLCWLTGAQSQH